MEKHKGIVSGINQKEGSYGVIIADIWYNGNGTCPVNKGDQVELEYEVNGEWRNIKKITVVDAAGTAEKFTETTGTITPTSMSNADQAKAVNTDVMKACELFSVIKGDEHLVGKANHVVMDECIELVKQARKALSKNAVV